MKEINIKPSEPNLIQSNDKNFKNESIESVHLNASNSLNSYERLMFSFVKLISLVINHIYNHNIDM